MAKPSPEPPRRRPWRTCRCAIRVARIAALGAVFLTLAGLTWLRLLGLPDFLRVRLVDELARRGIVAHFRSLHFHWFRGFVAEDLRVAWGGTNQPGLSIQIAEADLDVAPPLSWRGRSSLLRGFAVRRGNVTVPLTLTNEPPLDLRLEDITARIRFQAGDQWEVSRLAARLEGLRFELTAQITNTAALRRPGTRRPPDPAARERNLRLARAVVAELRSWTQASQARIAVNLGLDAEQPAAARGDIFVEVPSAHTPRGELVDFRFSTRVQPSADTNQPSHASVFMDFGEIRTGQGGLSQVSVQARLTGASGPSVPTNVAWQARIEHAFLPQFRARDVVLSGTTRIPATPDLRRAVFDSDLEGSAARLEIDRGAPERLAIRSPAVRLLLTASPSEPLPRRVEGTVSAESVDDALGSVGSTRVRLALSRREGASPAPAGVPGWDLAWPLTGDADLEVASVRSPRLAVESLRTRLAWEAPRLVLREVEAALYGGNLRARGDLNVLSRLLSVSAESTFDLHGIDGLLGPKSRENFVRYQWASPPWTESRGRVTLPPWGARDVDWEKEVKPTVAVDGRLRVGEGSFKGIPFDQAISTISFDGSTWRLPDLRTRRPEGAQEIAVEYNEDTREYRIDARGRVLPPVLKPVLGTQSGEILDLFEFKEGVEAAVSVWGPWTEGTSQSIRGSMVASNFTFRSQPFDRLDATVSYTNRYMVASPVRLIRPEGEATADGVGYDFAEDRLWLTNAVSTMEPRVAAAAISPSFPAKLEHYRFATPPRVTANGTLKPKDTASAQLDFTVRGGPFEFWRLRAETLESDLLWRGNTLVLTNIGGRFFDGTLAGNAWFDLADPTDGPYRFEAQIRQAELGPLLRHATAGRTNVASGSFDLDLNIDSARTADLHSWNGSGHAILRDGLLWDAPIFGFASPILNAVVPGLGNNRARAAEATFTLTNSLIHSRDLTIDCPPAKLFYRGTLDFEQNVNAKVEAQVLGNFTPMGPLFGLILRPLTKLFEFRAAGTLSDVKVEPLYVPKFLLLPLQPFRLLKGLLSGPEGTARHETFHTQPEIPLPGDPPGLSGSETNAPPATPPAESPTP